MGALHEGHLSLIRRAASENEAAWVSIFVNPLQFGPGEDFSRYPRSEAQDFEAAEAAGCRVMFAPDVTTMLADDTTSVVVPDISDLWEGTHRPGHFVGVATIVLKLFNILRPRVAYFGWKDFQQCMVIRRMVEDLFVPVELTFCDTVREADGLAMSSRNRYLSPAERAKAVLLYQTLMNLRSGLRSVPGLETTGLFETAVKVLSGGGFSVDYLALVDEKTLQQVDRWQPCARLIVAARIGSTRLIDNVSTDG
ncbi:MAG: Pantothenate synthetase [Fimbriimonadaceae bacterium]|nr:Pantothenate synthetase [Fimbriimonadaceae bacterium]